MSLRLSPEAEADLDQFWLYVASESGSVDIANRFIETITDRFWLLGTYPRIGRRRDVDLRAGLRSFAVGDFLILYRLQSDGTVILRVIRGNRDIEGILGD